MDDWTDANFAGDDDADGEPATNGAVNDGLPGVPVPGYPGLRAGAFGQGDGALGIYRTSDSQDVGGPSAELIPVADHPAANPSKVLGDYETNSWRWNDLNALAYDLQDKQKQLNEALALGQASNRAGYGETAAAGAGLYGGMSLGELLELGLWRLQPQG